MSDGNNEKLWLALMVKDRYAHDFDRQKIKESLLSLLGINEKDVFYAPFKKGNPYSYYVFVREYNRVNDLYAIFNSPLKDCLTGYHNNKVHITNEELKAIAKQCSEIPANDVRFGDFVKINSGVYSGLYGIVIRKSTRKNFVCVGMKFCFGKIVVECHTGDLEQVGNLFKYIKVLH